jgi:hypothetical protein
LHLISLPKADAARVLLDAVHGVVTENAVQAILELNNAVLEVSLAFLQLVNRLIGVPRDLSAVVIDDVLDLSLHGSGKENRQQGSGCDRNEHFNLMFLPSGKIEEAIE